MLLRCCLIHITIIILKHILYLSIFLCMSRPKSLCRIFFIYFLFSASFSLPLIFNVIQTDALVFCTFFRILFLDNNLNEECEQFSNNKSSASVCCLAFVQFFTNVSLALFMKVLLIRKRVLKNIGMQSNWNGKYLTQVGHFSHVNPGCKVFHFGEMPLVSEIPHII